MGPPVIRIPVEGGKEHEIHLKYSPYYRNQQYQSQVNGSLNVRTDSDFEREAHRLRRQLDWGLIPKTADEIQSEYSNEAIDRVVPAFGRAGSNDGVKFVNEQHDLSSRSGNFFEHCFESVFEFAAKLCSRDQRTHV